MPTFRLILVLLVVVLPPLAHAAAPPPRPRLPEGLRMLRDILLDKETGPDTGWFGPSESLYGWPWLAKRHGIDPDKGAISPKAFQGPKAHFLRLDRDGDGRLTAADFDWSPRSPLVRQERLAEALFRRGDRNLNGRLSADEWQGMFKYASAGKNALTPEDLRRILFPPPPPADMKPPPGMGPPSQLTMLRGFFTGEIGSFFEGPSLGDAAPPFTLRTHDNKRTISLEDYRDKGPVVLIFGSFT